MRGSEWNCLRFNFICDTCAALDFDYKRPIDLAEARFFVEPRYISVKLR